MRIGPFLIRERRAPNPKEWERGFSNAERAMEWQVVEGRKIIFRADTFKQAERWAEENKPEEEVPADLVLEMLREEGVSFSFLKKTRYGDFLVGIALAEEVKEKGWFARAGFCASFTGRSGGLPLRSIIKSLKAAQMELEANVN